MVEILILVCLIIGIRAAYLWFIREDKEEA